MSDRIHVTMALDLFVEDAAAMRQAAFERLQGAWSSEDDFPYESEADVPLDEAVHSLLADALPAELPGCRRSQLEVEVESQSGADSKTDSRDDADATEDDADAEPSADGDGDESDDPSESDESDESDDKDR
ncbi:MAG TPA: hypothetical protein VFD59_18280 [Nocardioidaceae bacterium]|nr:hypothetical protein [Nocardioidaceae bacterium]